MTILYHDKGMMFLDILFYGLAWIHLEHMWILTTDFMCFFFHDTDVSVCVKITDEVTL